MIPLHERENPDTRDAFFVCGGNIDKDDGGGVIGSRNTIDGAKALQRRAIAEGYRGVRILTYAELMAEPEPSTTD